MTKFTEHTDGEESTASEVTSSGYLSGVLERLARPAPTAYFADGGQTFALEGVGEREWLTAEEPVEVRP